MVPLRVHDDAQMSGDVALRKLHDHMINIFTASITPAKPPAVAAGAYDHTTNIFTAPSSTVFSFPHCASEKNVPLTVPGSSEKNVPWPPPPSPRSSMLSGPSAGQKCACQLCIVWGYGGVGGTDARRNVFFARPGSGCYNKMVPSKARTDFPMKVA